MTRELETKLVIRADGTDAERGIKRVTSQLEGLADSARKNTGKIESFEAATADLEKMASALDEARKRLSYFREQAKNAGDAGAKEFASDIKATEREVDRLNTSIEKHNAKLRSMAANLEKAGIDTKNLASEKARLAEAIRRAETGIIQLKGKLLEEQAAAAQAAAKTKDAGDSVEKTGSQADKGSASIADLARSLAGLTASAAAIKAVATQAIDFESAMADVAKVTDGSDEQIAALARRIKELSTELPISADGLAQMAAAGGQLGIPIENLERFIEISAKMATAFGLSAEEAGASMAKLMNVFSLSLDQVEQLGDAVNILGNTTAAREADIVEFLVRVGGSARQFGLVAEQVSALGTALISMGTAPQVAANSINALLSKLQTANVAGDEFQSGLARIGVSAEKLGADIRANPQAALTEFLKTLEKLDGQSRAEVLTKLFGLEYQDDISKLVGSLRLYEQALINITDKARVAGAMSAEFQKRIETTSAQIDLLKNSIEIAAINLGTVFLPALNATAKPLGDVAQGMAAFAEQNPEIAALAISIGTAAASVGALKLAFNGLGALAGAGAVEMGRFKKSVMEVEAEIGKLGLAMHVLSAGVVGWEIGTWAYNNFGIVRKAGVLMVEALVRGFEDLQFKWESFKAIFTDDTVEQATARHIRRLQELDDHFRQAYKGAEDGPRKVAKATDAAAASQAALGKAGYAAGTQVAAGLQQAATAVGKADEGAKQLAEDLKKLHIDPEEFKSGLTTMEKSLNDSFGRMIKNADVSSDMLLRGFGEAINEVGLKGLEAFEFAAHDAFQAGRLSADQLAAALSLVELRREKLTSGVSELEAAYVKLGLRSQAALNEVAKDMRGAYDTLVQLNAPLNDQNAAWVKYAEAAIAANGGVASATIQAEAAMRGYKITVDDAGKATIRLKDVTEDFGEKSTRAWQRAQQAAAEADQRTYEALQSMQEGVGSTQDSIDDFHAHLQGLGDGMANFIHSTRQAVASLTHDSEAALAALQQAIRGVGLENVDTYIRRVVEMRNLIVRRYEEEREQADALIAKLGQVDGANRELIRTTELAAQEMRYLDQETLDRLADSIEQAKNRMRELEEASADTLARIEEEWLRLNGRLAELEELRGAKALAELQAQLAAARAAGDLEAIRNLERALQLQREINAAAIEEARIREGRNSGSSSPSSWGGGTGTGSGGRSGVTNLSPSLTINVNGAVATDAERLARLIIPELERISRLTA